MEFEHTNAVGFLNGLERGSFTKADTELRVDWTRTQAGLSLCLLGLMAVIDQGYFAKPLVSRFGPRVCVLFALATLALTMLGFSLNSVGAFVYPLLLLGALSGIGGPALQSFVAIGDSRN